MTQINPDIAAKIEHMIHEDEGGWVFTDRRDDSGGATYGGMTWRTFDHFQHKVDFPHKTTYRKFTKHTFAMTARGEFNDGRDRQKDLQGIIILAYYHIFWLGCKVDEVPRFAQAMFFSACVNMGKKHATKALQKAHNTIAKSRHLVVDGVWGPKTANQMDELEISHESGSPLVIDNLDEKFKLAFSDAVIDRCVKIVQANAREWRRVAQGHAGVNRAEVADARDYELPRVLQSENLRGWINRARRYRSM